MIRDHGILAAHDSGNANCLLAVTDHENRIVHGAFLTIQGYKLLALCCTANHDLVTCNGVKVIGMHRLAVFFHNVVGDIYNVIDRADSLGGKTAL